MTNIETALILLVRDGNSLTVLPAHGDDLPEPILKEIDSELSYQYKTCDWRGRMQLTKKLMYSHENGMVLTTIGMTRKLVDLIGKLSFRVKLKDNTDPERNPMKIQPNWDYVSDLSFRPMQKECLQSIAGSAFGVIVAPTGFGKTYLIGALGKLYPKAKIHVCTKSVEIARRIYSDLSRLLPSVGMIGGGSRSKDHRVTVITADSLEHSSGECDFFFFDECHQAAAETYSNVILQLYTHARRYGFTATPTGRSDGADPVLELLFGPKIFELSYQQGVDLGLVVPISVRWLSCYSSSIPVNTFNRNTMRRKRDYIWRNSIRNQLIADDIRNQTTTGNILVLAETIEHAVLLKQLLPDFELCYSDMSDEDLHRYQNDGLLPDDYVQLSKKDRLALCADFTSGKVKRVISTDVWSTGVDFPSLSLVYNVSGRVSAILTAQGGGRASRVFAGKKEGTVVDIQDLFSPEFKAFSKKRYETYEKLGWKQSGFVTADRKKKNV